MRRQGPPTKVWIQEPVCKQRNKQGHVLLVSSWPCICWCQVTNGLKAATGTLHVCSTASVVSPRNRARPGCPGNAPLSGKRSSSGSTAPATQCRHSTHTGKPRQQRKQPENQLQLPNTATSGWVRYKCKTLQGRQNQPSNDRMHSNSKLSGIT